MISTDAANCYEKNYHAILALIFLCLGVGKGPIAAMLVSIQLIKLFLRTGWGESTYFIEGAILNILRGLYQGNGAAPASWMVLSLVLVRVYKRLGYGSKTRTPMTRV